MSALAIIGVVLGVIVIAVIAAAALLVWVAEFTQPVDLDAEDRRHGGSSTRGAK